MSCGCLQRQYRTYFYGMQIYRAASVPDGTVEKEHAPVYDFVTEDEIGHRVWVIDGDGETEFIKKNLERFLLFILQTVITGPLQP